MNLCFAVFCSCLWFFVFAAFCFFEVASCAGFATQSDSVFFCSAFAASVLFLPFVLLLHFWCSCFFVFVPCVSLLFAALARPFCPLQLHSSKRKRISGPSVSGGGGAVPSPNPPSTFEMFEVIIDGFYLGWKTSQIQSAMRYAPFYLSQCTVYTSRDPMHAYEGIYGTSSTQLPIVKISPALASCCCATREALK